MEFLAPTLLTNLKWTGIMTTMLVNDERRKVMGQKFHKLNSKYGIIDYPILLKDLESIIQEFPKSERKFYE